MTVIYFIIALGILVLAHEWGHFIVARWSGIRVEKFSVGFGPKLFGFRRGDTEYCVSLLPLGGYVKLFGEDPLAEAEGDLAKAKKIAESKEAFSSKPLKKRLATVFAGPVMNLLLCLVFMPAVFMLGRQIPSILLEAPKIIGIKADSPAEKAGFRMGDQILKIDDRLVSNWTDVMQWIMLYPNHKATVLVDRKGRGTPLSLSTISSPFMKQEVGYAGFEPLFFWGNDPVIGEVQPSSPAMEAHLQAGDRILKIDNQVVVNWDDMTKMIREGKGEARVVTLRRGNVVQKTRVTPVYHKEYQTWMIGITKFVDPANTVKKRYGFFEALREGMRENAKLFLLTGDVLARLFTFQLSYKALGGPLQIAEATGAAARSGLGEFIYFLAFLSMQLGILNLLPIPVLDGGHLLFMAIEGIRKKPVSVKIRNVATQVGLVLLLSLMVLITFNDIDRIWGLSGIWEKIRGIF